MAEIQPLHQYLNEMANRYTAWFDVYREDQLGSIPLSFSAHFKRRDEKYLVTKTIKVWSLENDQHIYVTHFNKQLTLKEIKKLKEELMETSKNQLPNHPEHMSTIFTAIVVTDQEVDQEVVKFVKKFRKLKFIKYGLHGWYELYIGIVNIQNRQVYIHSKGKEFIQPFKQSIQLG